MTPEVLFCDNHLLIVCKPAGLPAQQDRTGDEDLLCLMKAYIKQRFDKPGDVYLGLVTGLTGPCRASWHLPALQRPRAGCRSSSAKVRR